MIKINESIKVILAKNKSKNSPFPFETPQLIFNVKKGDKLFLRAGGKNNFVSYTGISILKNKKDRKKRQIRRALLTTNLWPVYPAKPNGTLPRGLTFTESGKYSTIIYSRVQNNQFEIVIVPLYIPPKNEPIQSITENYQIINYTVDKRNELYSAFTSNQFTINAKQGTKLIIDYSDSTTDEKWQDYVWEDAAEFNFYDGKEQLTAENIYNRYINRLEVNSCDNGVPSQPSQTICFSKEGEYSIIFTNYSQTKQTHKIKFKNE